VRRKSGAEVAKFKSSQHLAQYRSSAFDGEAAFNGEGPIKSVKARIHGDHGIGDNTHVVMHDLAHSTDLLIGAAHAADPYVREKVHPIIKAVYTYYVSSPKRKRRLMKLVDKMDKENVFLELHHLQYLKYVLFLQSGSLLKTFLLTFRRSSWTWKTTSRMVKI
jgi:hypothetical protein